MTSFDEGLQALIGRGFRFIHLKDAGGLHIQSLMLRGNAFSWVVPLDVARALRDQLTEHLVAVQ